MRLRYILGTLLLALVALAPGQQFHNIYNRDTGAQFKVLDVQTKSEIRGPIVVTTTTMEFENPYTKLTEASFNFSVAPRSALGGFAYWYMDEYVLGELMDKDMAWFIYTAITSRNRDPGIMEQVGQTQFHAQIYPLAIGYPLRIELKTVDFLVPAGDRDILPQPMLTGLDGVPSSWEILGGGKPVYRWTNEHDQMRAAVASDNWAEPLALEIRAERFRDGQIYVAGIARGDIGKGSIKIEGLKDLVMLPFDGEGYAPINELKRQEVLTRSVRFVGIATGNVVRATQGDLIKTTQIAASPGVNTSKLWAQAQLHNPNRRWSGKPEVLNFSLKYQVPSRYTALLAVPSSEKALFEKAKQEYLAELRRQKREEERRQREWERNRQLNTNWTRGGDPEIRVSLPGAIRAFALLPDGRILELQRLQGDLWYGNFEVSTNSAEGEYEVKVYGLGRNGERIEEVLTYHVSRNAPDYRSRIEVQSGKTYLVVEGDKNLARVELLLPDGRRFEFEEVSAGVFRLELPAGVSRAELIVVDSASNRVRAPWHR